MFPALRFPRTEEQEALWLCQQEAPGSSGTGTVAARPDSSYSSHPEQEARRAQAGGPRLKPR